MIRILFIILVLFASCNKEITEPDFIGHQKSKEYSNRIYSGKIIPYENDLARGKAGGFFYTGLHSIDERASNIQGISALTDVKKLRVGSAEMKSWWIRFYMDINGQRKFIQWGYGTHKFFGNISIFEVFVSSPDGWIQTDPHATFISGSPLKYGIKQKFAIYNYSGTVWRVSIDDIDVWELDLGVTQSNSQPAGVFTESQGSNTFPDRVNTKDIQTLKYGIWVVLPSGRSAIANWTLEGKIQNSTLGIGEVNFGGRGIVSPAGTTLWQ